MNIYIYICMYICMYCIALHCIALHCFALRCIALYCIVLYCIAYIYIYIYIIYIHIYIYTISTGMVQKQRSFDLKPGFESDDLWNQGRFHDPWEKPGFPNLQFLKGLQWQLYGSGLKDVTYQGRNSSSMRWHSVDPPYYFPRCLMISPRMSYDIPTAVGPIPFP